MSTDEGIFAQLSSPQLYGAFLCGDEWRRPADLAERCGVSPVRAARWLASPRFRKAVTAVRAIPKGQRRDRLKELLPPAWRFAQAMGTSNRR